MQKIITYNLLFLFSLAFSYETISFFSKKISDTFLAEDINGCENDSQKSDEPGDENENEKRDSLEDLYLHQIPGLTVISQSYFKQCTDFIFPTSDYSSTVYSPPELFII